MAKTKKVPSAIVVQCRFNTTTIDIYTDALSQLGIKLLIEESSRDKIKGKVEATAQFGFELIAKLKGKSSVEGEIDESSKTQLIGHDVNDLRFIAQLIKESGKRLVIEDFHYLKIPERKQFSFDLKALWDYGCFVIIVGVLSRNDLLISLNDDLTDRIQELSVEWADSELRAVIEQGGKSLNLDFSDELKNVFVSNSYKNVGLLQKLILAYLDELDIDHAQDKLTHLNDVGVFDSAAMLHAEQLDTRYQKFAKDVSSGIRTRKDSTGIYAYAMAIIVSADDSQLLNGLSLDSIFASAHARQSRIQKSNLRIILKILNNYKLTLRAEG